MGPKCSKNPIHNSVGITGNGNSAIVINGINYNISNIFESSINFVMQAYRLELILTQFTSLSLILISTLLLLRCLRLRSATGKDTTL